MKAEIDADLSRFAQRVIPWLQQDPVVHNVLCTVIGSRASGRIKPEKGALWARAIDADGMTRGVAVRTPPLNLLVSELSPAAATQLAATIKQECGDDGLPGVAGPVTGVRPFVEAWQAATGVTGKTAMSQLIYRLDHVTPPGHISGRLRPAKETDAGMVTRWMEGFIRDTGNVTDAKPAIEAGRLIGAGELWIWEAAGRQAAMAAARQPVVGVSRISMVYTPPELRRRGFAAACVATLSQRVLDRGAKACMLYTDMANPSSNSIYQKVGYHPVTEAEMWQFSTN